MSAPATLPRWADVVLLPLVNLAMALVVAAIVVASIGQDPREVLVRTARTRRRPAWRIPERWIPISSVSTRAATTWTPLPWATSPFNEYLPRPPAPRLYYRLRRSHPDPGGIATP